MVVSKLERYGGRTPLVSSSKDTALFALSSGIQLRIKLASAKDWGLALIDCTGSQAHLRKLTAVTGILDGIADTMLYEEGQPVTFLESREIEDIYNDAISELALVETLIRKARGEA